MVSLTTTVMILRHERLTPVAIFDRISVCLSLLYVRITSLSGYNLMPLYQSARTYGLRTAQIRLHSVASDVMREFGAIRTIHPITSQP